MYSITLNVNLLSNILTLLVGILLGVVFGASIIFYKKAKNFNKAIDQRLIYNKSEVTEDYSKALTKYHIKARKNQVKLFGGAITLKKKVDYDLLLNELKEEFNITHINVDFFDKPYLSLYEELNLLVLSIAKYYYPNSNKPLFELTCNELFQMFRLIIDLVEDFIKSIGIKDLEYISIKEYKTLVTLGLKIKSTYDIKAVKTSIRVLNVIIRLQGLINPIYWINKGSKAVMITSFNQFIISYIFDIVAKTVSSVYENTKTS